MKNLPILLLSLCCACSNNDQGGDAGDGSSPDGALDGVGDKDAASKDATDATGPITATSGFCPVKDRIGLIRLVQRYHEGMVLEAMALEGMVYDKVPPFLGPAALADGDCEHFAPSFCPELCDKEQECDYSGSCRDPARALTGVVVKVSSPAAVETFEPHPTTRHIGGPITAAADDDPYELQVNIDGERPIFFNAKMPPPFDGGITTVDEGYNGHTGSTTTTWTSAESSARIRLYFHPNHHAGVGFTQCVTTDDAEEVFGSASVMDPLRPTTGLENIEVERTFVGSAQLDSGCVELAVSVVDSPRIEAP